MSRFKVGDKVRITNVYGFTDSLYVGREGILEPAYPGSRYPFRLRGGPAVAESEIEFIEPELPKVRDKVLIEAEVVSLTTSILDSRSEVRVQVYDAGMGRYADPIWVTSDQIKGFVSDGTTLQVAAP